MNSRADLLRRLTTERFDLVTVGGGITGSAIASRAARYGLSVALLERHDFAAGTTSASSKMLHGGLRYLEHRQFGLVKEALRERGRLVRRLGPTRTRVVPFILPLRGAASDRWKMRFGTWMYQRLSGSLALGPRKLLSPQEVVDRVPSINTDGLRGGVLYYEGIVDDVLLVLHLVQEAVSHGAVAVNHAPVTGLHVTGGKASGVEFHDEIGGKDGTVQSHGVVNAAGVWSRGWPGERETPGLRPSKGVHLVFRGSRFPLQDAVVLAAPDGRWVFALPYGRLTIVGTTDTDYTGPLDEVVPETEDVQYLLETANREFPGVHLTARDIVDNFAGLRPLLAGKGGSTGDLSREDAVVADPSGLLTTVGGKLTTHAAMAERTLRVYQNITGIRLTGDPDTVDGTTPADPPWPGTSWLDDVPTSGNSQDQRPQEPLLKALSRLTPASLEDVLDRRIHYLERLSPIFPKVLELVVQQAAEDLGWSPEERGRQLAQYRAHLDKLHRAARSLGAGTEKAA